VGLLGILEREAGDPYLNQDTPAGETGFTQPGDATNLQLGAALTFCWMIAFGIWGGLRGRILRPRGPEELKPKCLTAPSSKPPSSAPAPTA